MAPTFRYRFVDFGTRFEPRANEERTNGHSYPGLLYANEVATDVGSRCWLVPGDPFVIDHHFTRKGQFPSSSAAVLHVAPRLWEMFHGRGGIVWLVTHCQPDFDALSSQYLVKTVIESDEKPDWTKHGVAGTEWTDVALDGATIKKIEWFHPRFERIDQKWHWQLKLASYASLVDSCSRIHCPKKRALHSILYAALYRGRNYRDEVEGASEFFDAIKEKLENSNLNPALDSILEDSPEFAPELELLDQESDAYTRDVHRARKAIVYVHRCEEFSTIYEEIVQTPLMEAAPESEITMRQEHLRRFGDAREPADGIYIRDPECLLFKEWARLDTENSSLQNGFLFTAVAYSGEREKGQINQTDYFFALDPERAEHQGLHLYPVWARLEAAELRAIRNTPEECLRRKGLAARSQFEKRAAGMESSLWNDPWFDGGNYACTLVATPNDGSLIGTPGKNVDLSDDLVTQIVREELEFNVFSKSVHIRDFSTEESFERDGQPVPADLGRAIPVRKLGQAIKPPKSTALRFAQAGLHDNVNTSLGDAGAQIGEVLWRILHPDALGLSPDFDQGGLIIEPDAVSVWSLNGVAVACKSGNGLADCESPRGQQLESIFAEIVRLRQETGALLLSLETTHEPTAEEKLKRSEELLSDFGKLQYRLSFRQNGVLRKFFDAICLGEVLETLRDRHATASETKRSEELRESTNTIAEVQSKVEWLEVLFVGFYSIEFVNVLLEHWHQQVTVATIAVVGTAFLLIAYKSVNPAAGKFPSKPLRRIMFFLIAIMVAAGILSLLLPNLIPPGAPWPGILKRGTHIDPH